MFGQNNPGGGILFSEDQHSANNSLQTTTSATSMFGTSSSVFGQTLLQGLQRLDLTLDRQDNLRQQLLHLVSEEHLQLLLLHLVPLVHRQGHLSLDRVTGQTMGQDCFFLLHLEQLQTSAPLLCLDNRRQVLFSLFLFGQTATTSAPPPFGLQTVGCSCSVIWSGKYWRDVWSCDICSFQPDFLSDKVQALDRRQLLLFPFGWI